MSEIEKFLQKFNAKIDRIKDNTKGEKYFLKIRSFPKKEILDFYQWDSSIPHRDEFYDTPDITNLHQAPRKFYRRRDNIVQQISEDIHLNSYIYSKMKYLTDEMFEQLPLTRYLSYTFSRQYGEKVEGRKNYEVYLDRIDTPITYQIITWKVELPSDDFATIRETVLSLEIPNFELFPLYTKFIYMLQTSSRYSLFDEVFEPSLRYIEEDMKTKLSTAGAQTTGDGQYYLWSFGQIVHFQVLYDHLMDEVKVYQGIERMRDQVYRNLSNNIFGLHLISSEEEEFIFD